MNISDIQEIISGKKKKYFEKIENFCKEDEIKIFILKLENKKEYFYEQIQFYEDLLWDYYKPLLGRRSPK